MNCPFCGKMLSNDTLGLIFTHMPNLETGCLFDKLSIHKEHWETIIEMNKDRRNAEDELAKMKNEHEVFRQEFTQKMIDKYSAQAQTVTATDETQLSEILGRLDGLEKEARDRWSCQAAENHIIKKRQDALEADMNTHQHISGSTGPAPQPEFPLGAKESFNAMFDGKTIEGSYGWYYRATKDATGGYDFEKSRDGISWGGFSGWSSFCGKCRIVPDPEGDKA